MNDEWNAELIETEQRFRDELAHTLEMVMELGAECKYFRELIKNKDTQVHRRAYIRALFAMIEGTLHRMKASTETVDRIFNRCTVYEKLALRDKNFKLKDNGDILEENAFLKLEANFKFAFKSHAKSYNYVYELNPGSKSWSRFQDSIKVRNRLVHPKSVSDLSVSEDELKNAINTSDWFLFTYQLSYLLSQKATSDGNPSTELDTKIQNTRHNLKILERK